MGAIILQGPHHSAQKSSSTGLSDLSTSWVKVASVVCTMCELLTRFILHGRTKSSKFRKGNLRLRPVETGGQRRKPCQKHPLNGYTVIYMGKKNLMAGGAPSGSGPGYFLPRRIGTPVLSTFLALPNAIFKALTRNPMTLAKQ